MGGGAESPQVKVIDNELSRRWNDPQLVTPKVQNDIVVNVRVDDRGRVSSDVNDMGTTVRPQSNRGDFFAAVQRYGMLTGH